MFNIQTADYITVALARTIEDGDRVFHGVASPMPVVAIRLAQQLQAKNAVYLSITGAVDAKPKTLPKFSTADHLLRAGAITEFGLTDIFDLSARGSLDVAFLSGAQIDGEGRLNLSAIGSYNNPKVRLPGGAGSAALLPTVRRGVLWKTNHDRRSFVDRLDVVTAAGNTDIVVTPLCIFKRCEDGKLRVKSVFPTSNFNEVIDNTAFPIEKHEQYEAFPPIRDIELTLLQEIDPEGLRYTEFV